MLVDERSRPMVWQLLASLCIGMSSAHASVDMDPDFPFPGNAPISLVSGEERSHAIALEANGRIILAGRVDISPTPGPPNYRLGLARLNADGTPDNGFNGNGTLIFMNACGAGALASGGSGSNAGKNIAVQPDGKILLVASCTTPAPPHYEYAIVARFNTDGTLDTSFHGDGIFAVPVGPSDIESRGYAVALQADGRILFGGELSPNFPPRTVFVRRLMPDGTVDTSFGANGLYAPDGVPDPLIAVIRVMSDGRIVIGGSARVFGGNDFNFFIERLTAGGVRDTTFNVTGSLSFNVGSLPASTNPGQPSQDFCYDIALRPDGSILCAGTTLPPDGFQLPNAVVAQFTPSGALDTNWGQGGFVSPAPQNASSDALAVGVRPGGDIFITGRNMPPTQVQLDGLNSTNFNGVVEGWSLAIQSDQRIVVAADAGPGNTASANFLAKRFIATIPPPPDTTPDPFSFASVTNTPLSAVITSAPATISGLASAADVAVANGEFSIGCNGVWVASGGTRVISNGGVVCVRHDSGTASSTDTVTTLTIGGVQGTFTSSSGDATPDAFTFTDQTGVAKSTTITSAALTVSGITIAAPISITGGEYSIGCGSTYSNAAATVSNGQTVCVRQTSSASASTKTTTTLTIGGVVGSFSSTTAADAPVPPPAPTPTPTPSPAKSGGGGGSIDAWLLALLIGLVVGSGHARTNASRSRS
jgi:uncharacterized delta-60 repeat protein